MSMVSIQKGDTLGGLVARYNRQHGTKLTVAQVAQANGLKDANKIIAGTKLIFPDQFETKAKQQVIRNGDNQKLVRNGVRETVDVKIPQDDQLVTTSPTPLLTELQLRPQLPLPQPPVQLDSRQSEDIRRERLKILQ